MPKTSSIRSTVSIELRLVIDRHTQTQTDKQTSTMASTRASKQTSTMASTRAIIASRG